MLSSLGQVGRIGAQWIATLIKKVASMEKKLERCKGDLSGCKERLRLALAHRYGEKSERVQRLALDSGQVLLGLFTAGISEQTQVESAAAPEAEMTSGDDSSSENEKKKKKRKKKEHKPFDVSKLDRVVVSSSKFSDDARICKCCGIEMCQVTTQIQERIGFRPARLVVEVNEREVLACKACDTAPVRAPNLIAHLSSDNASWTHVVRARRHPRIRVC